MGRDGVLSAPRLHPFAMELFPRNSTAPGKASPSKIAAPRQPRDSALGSRDGRGRGELSNVLGRRKGEAKKLVAGFFERRRGNENRRGVTPVTWKRQSCCRKLAADDKSPKMKGQEKRKVSEGPEDKTLASLPVMRTGKPRSKSTEDTHVE